MHDVLVLDAAYRPHEFVSWQKAACYLFEDKVEVVEEFDTDIRAVSITIKAPAVVRLLDFVAGNKRSVKFSRASVFERDRFTCQYCGHKKTFSGLNFDHVIPRAQGGTTTWTNIVASCYPCNARKDGRTPEQAGMTLLHRPVRPRTLPITMLRVPRGTPVHDKQATYLYWTGELDEER